jgi:uncharacterized protein (DUF427 family)
MSRPVLQPSAEHPITVEQSTEKVTVTLDGRTIAASERALVLRESTYPAAYYVPREDLVADEFAPSDTTTYCPFKGDATYLSAGDVTDVAWSYEQPYDAVAEIAHHVAFYPNKVDIQVV